MTGPYRVDLLGKQHNRTAFSSGQDDLDHYFRERAGQDQRRGVATVYVLIDTLTETVAGYYTLSATGVKLTEFPVDITRKLPRYPLVPATLWAGLPSTKPLKDEATAASCLPTHCFAQSVARSHRSRLSSTQKMRHRAASINARASCRFWMNI